jgi:hypothetical protein
MGKALVALGQTEEADAVSGRHRDNRIPATEVAGGEQQ